MSSSVLFSERRNKADVHSFRNASNLEFMRIESSGIVSFASNVNIEQLNVNGTIVANQVSGNATGLTGLAATALVGTLTLAQGGTGSNLTATNGGIFYSTATAAALLPGTAFEGRILQSGSTANPAPKWSTPTYPMTASGTAGTLLRSDGTNIAYTATTWPTTVAVNNILYSSAGNTIAGLAPVSSGVLTTSVDSVPSYVQGTTADRILRTDGQNITFDRLNIATDVRGSTAGKVLVGSSAVATPGAIEMPTLLHWDSTNSRLGIGTAVPTQKLQVNGDALVDNLIWGSAGVKRFSWKTPSTASWNYTCDTNDTILMSGTNVAVILNYDGGERVKTISEGALVTGELRVTGDLAAFYSDARLKKDIEPIAGALDKLRQVSGIFYRQDDALATALGLRANERLQVGVLAQEIEKIMPECVAPAPFDIDDEGKSRSGENYLTVKYDRLVPLLIQAIKELEAMVIQGR